MCIIQMNIYFYLHVILPLKKPKTNKTKKISIAFWPCKHILQGYDKLLKDYAFYYVVNDIFFIQMLL